MLERDDLGRTDGTVPVGHSLQEGIDEIRARFSDFVRPDRVENTPKRRIFRRSPTPVVSPIQVLDVDKQILQITATDFRSPTYLRAGYQYMTDRYGESDRSLHIIQYADGTETLIASGKTSDPNNGFEVMHASMGVQDLRRTFTSMFMFDTNGVATVVATREGLQGPIAENRRQTLDVLYGSMGTVVAQRVFTDIR